MSGRRSCIQIGRGVVFITLGALCGCSGGGGSGSKATTGSGVAGGGSSSGGTAFQVVGFEPTDAPVSTVTELRIRFSRAVDLSTVTHGSGAGSDSLVVVEDVDETPGGRFDTLIGSVSFDQTGTVLTWIPPRSLQAEHEVRLVLTSDVSSVDGTPLATGATSSPLSLASAVKRSAFEGRCRPRRNPASPPANPNGGGNGGGGTPAPPPAPAPSAFTIVDSNPAFGATPDDPQSVTLRFSDPVSANSLVAFPRNGATVIVLQDRDTTQGGAHEVISVAMSLRNGRRDLQISFQEGLLDGLPVVVILTDRVTSQGGVTLTSGGVSGSLTATRAFPNQAFETRFTPDIQAASPPPPPPPPPVATPAPPSAVPNPAAFTLQTGTDPWFIDFEQRGSQFTADMDAHGLLSGSNTVDDLLRRRVMHGVLSTCSLKFRRAVDGSAVTGRSFGISFTPTRPSGTPGRSFSRMAVGGSSGSSALGVARLDPGNRRREDNSGSSLGVFSRFIRGRSSTLRTSVRSSEVRFVDGSYQLGDGSASDDARFRSIRTVIADWSQAVGTVTAHEVGHSVGLGHDDTRRNIMNSAASSVMLSDPDSTFTSSHLSSLSSNLGVQ